MSPRFLLCLLLYFVFFITQLRGDETSFSDVQIDPTYREALLANPFLMQGAVDVVKASDGSEVLVGVGSVRLREASPQARNTARTIATAKARALVAKYLKTDISVVETLQKKTVDEYEKNGDEIVARRKRVSKLLETWITEKASMTRKSKLIGTWLDSSDMFYCAVCIFIEN